MELLEITATHADEGITQLLSNFCEMLSQGQVNKLKRLRTTINGELEKPDNTRINLHIDTYIISILIGKGESIKNIYLQDTEVNCYGRHDDNLKSIKLSTYQSFTNSAGTASDILKTSLGAGLGAFLSGGVYLTLCSNPVAGNVTMAAIGGAMIGSGAIHFYNKLKGPEIIITTNTFETEIPVKKREKYP